IALVLILNGTVFTIDTIDVDFDLPQSEKVEQELSASVVSASGLKIGKNVFTVSESTMVKNIQAKVPNVKILGVERIFPNKVVIHASRRIAVLAIPFKQNQSSNFNYAIVDSEMVVLEIKDELPRGLSSVLGFQLIGNYNIAVGKELSVKFGKEVYYLQNIAVSFMKAGLNSEEFSSFVSKISFVGQMIHILTNSGVDIILGSNGELTSEEISARVMKSYEWYKGFSETAPEIKSGYAYYNTSLCKFVWNDN
ncbi:MAG: FtsQ-type POTRA domain-containing protein, partial [Clostridia bacterium]